MDPGLWRDGLVLLLGVATGVLSALFGVGGATISTPGIRALGASAADAVGTTLPSIIPGAAAGTLRYGRAGLIEWRAVAATAPPGVAAAVGGSILSAEVPGDGHLLMVLTAVLLGLSAYRLGRSQSSADSEPEPEPEPVGPRAESDQEMVRPAEAHRRSGRQGQQPATATTVPDTADLSPGHRSWRLAIVGTLSGLLSGLLGIGGGIVMVPGFTQVAGMKVKQAIATSLVCVALFAVPGTVTHAVIGDIDWRFALLLAAGVIPGARLGSALALRIPDRRLGLVVAMFLGGTAIVYGVSETIALFS